MVYQFAGQVNYGRNLFERLERLGHDVHILNIQYRMHPIDKHFPKQGVLSKLYQEWSQC